MYTATVYLSTSDRHIWQISHTGFLIGHKAETQPGSSGCPVLKEYKREWVLAGLHRGEKPKGVPGTDVNLATHVEAIHRTLTDPNYKPEGTYIYYIIMHTHTYTCTHIIIIDNIKYYNIMMCMGPPIFLLEIIYFQDILELYIILSQL